MNGWWGFTALFVALLWLTGYFAFADLRTRRWNALGTWALCIAANAVFLAASLGAAIAQH